VNDLSKDQVLPRQPATYTRTAISLHWAIALLIFAAFPLGLYMHNLPLSPDKLKLFSYHKWIGITVLILAVVRVAWRVNHRLPDLPATMPRWERFSALAMHFLLYALILAVPLSGWLMSSATGFQTVWFGVVPLPDLIGKDKELGRLLLELHQSLNFLLITLVSGHIAAALKHHFVAHDRILARMVPSLRKSDSKFAVEKASGESTHGIQNNV
jgi:cytochrome b561